MISGIDTGGTFTDCIVFEGDQARVYKRLSTPKEPSEAVIDGLNTLARCCQNPITHLVHGTTVATNALLEHKGACVTLLITAGFRDLIQIGRQNRPKLYLLQQDRDGPLYQHVLEVNQRTAADGSVITPLTDDEITRLITAIPLETEAIAICLLFAYAFPEDEKRLARALRQAGWTVSVSHEVLPVYREYERFSTTVANASLQPIMQKYMQHLEQGLNGLPCHLMQSNGGSLSPEYVAQFPVRCALSGPAGGILGALEVGRQLGITQSLTFDMGGTSTDVALLTGSLPLQTESVINDVPLALPMLAIHTVGAGGGSLARVDAGGALRVGPESAGSEPGPMCYGKGQQITVTDAHVFLGHIPASSKLGGSLALHVAPLEAAFKALGETLKVSPEAAAEGVIAIANANMERALRVVSVEKGHDPREFSLFCFGGAGGLHACDLARSLHISQIISPAFAGVFSALGMLYADHVEDASLTVLGELMIDDQAGVREAFKQLKEQMSSSSDARFAYSVDLRYQGQSFEINLPWGLESAAAFHQEHEQLHGYCRREHPIELVTLRLRKICPQPHPNLPRLKPVEKPGGKSVGNLCKSNVWVDGQWQNIPIWQRADLSLSAPIYGPALIVEETSTLYLAPDFRAQLKPQGHLILSVCTRNKPGAGV